MKKSLLLTSYFLLLTSLLAAPAAKVVYEPVAEGYCSWAGLTEANFVKGRHLCPSDLRHKLAVIVFVDANDYAAQFAKIVTVTGRINPVAGAHGTSPETVVLPRDRICLVVINGKIDKEKVVEHLTKTKDLASGYWYVYSNVTGSKVPDAGGKYPFYCVFGSEPGDPLASGEYDAAAEKKIQELLRDPKNKLEDWKPYRGTVSEPQYMKTFNKILASGKPLESLMAACQKGITAKEPEKAKECQILYDALAQTCSDYLYDVQSFASSAPTRAIYEAQIVIKQWPKTKKLLKNEMEKIAAMPDMAGLIKMYAQLRKWGEPDFMCKNAAEAKKIEAELKKMKASCDALVEKKGTSAIAQSAAAYIAYEAENLAPTMSSRVQAK